MSCSSHRFDKEDAFLNILKEASDKTFHRSDSCPQEGASFQCLSYLILGYLTIDYLHRLPICLHGVLLLVLLSRRRLAVSCCSRPGGQSSSGVAIRSSGFLRRLGCPAAGRWVRFPGRLSRLGSPSRLLTGLVEPPGATFILHNYLAGIHPVVPSSLPRHGFSLQQWTRVPEPRPKKPFVTSSQILPMNILIWEQPDAGFGSVSSPEGPITAGISPPTPLPSAESERPTGSPVLIWHPGHSIIPASSRHM